MKNLSLALNVVLIIAVGVLYYFQFASNNEGEVKAVNANEQISLGDGIVFVNTDSLFTNYKMYEDLQQDIQDKINTSEAQFSTKQRDFEERVKDAQYKVNRGLVTRSEAAELQQSLAVEEQSLMQLQNQLQMQLAEEQAVAQRKMINSIIEYLESQEGDAAYKYVLGHTFGGNILYANSALDITNEVLSGLNSSYEAEKEANK